jgi:hypothetical protein
MARAKQVHLNPKHAAVKKLLNRKGGATVEQVLGAVHKEHSDVKTERQVRLIMDRMRYRGVRIENIGPSRFRVAEGRRA